MKRVISCNIKNELFNQICCKICQITLNRMKNFRESLIQSEIILKTKLLLRDQLEVESVSNEIQCTVCWNKGSGSISVRINSAESKGREVQALCYLYKGERDTNKQRKILLENVVEISNGTKKFSTTKGLLPEKLGYAFRITFCVQKK